MIMPIQPFVSELAGTTGLHQVDALQKKEQKTDGAFPFESIFKQAIDDVNTLNGIKSTEQAKFLSGESENFEDVFIASTKAGIAVDLLVQLRNRAFDAYSEIMRMTV